MHSIIWIVKDFEHYNKFLFLPSTRGRVKYDGLEEEGGWGVGDQFLSLKEVYL